MHFSRSKYIRKQVLRNSLNVIHQEEKQHITPGNIKNPMKHFWLKQLRVIWRVKSLTKDVRNSIHSMAQEKSQGRDYEKYKQQTIEKIIELIDACQQFFPTNTASQPLPNYEESVPEDAELSLKELLVLFRQTLQQFQTTPFKVQESAIEILDSYFIELQGLYDLIFVHTKKAQFSLASVSPSFVQDHQKRRLFTPKEIEEDPLIQEYRSIPYDDLMNISLVHHLRVALYLLSEFVHTGVRELFRRTPRCRRVLDRQDVDSLGTLRQLLRAHPLTQTVKVSVALQRHLMRIFDIVVIRIILRLGRPIFELLVLATWAQTVKDHIVPGIHKPDWEVEQLDVEREIIDKNGVAGKIKMSSAFFMQPRIKFGLERFLIFKNRTMTVGDIVRVHELGNWVRQNSLDELLQCFNIALGDMGCLGVRLIPEHEIVSSPETLWVYSALMSFMSGGMTSPGTIAMREANYNLTKTEQFLEDLLFYDPRFKKSSSLINDINAMLQTVRVLNKGRVGKALEQTESFHGRKREVV